MGGLGNRLLHGNALLGCSHIMESWVSLAKAMLSSNSALGRVVFAIGKWVGFSGGEGAAVVLTSFPLLYPSFSRWC